LIETEWFTGCSMTTVFLMFYLLLSANHTPKIWRGVKVNRGEFITSIGTNDKPGRLVVDTNIPISTLRDSLRRLKGLGEIEVTSHSGQKGYTLIKIVNYDLYTCSDKKAVEKTAENTNKKTNKKTVDNKEVKEAEEYKEYIWDDNE